MQARGNHRASAAFALGALLLLLAAVALAPVAFGAGRDFENPASHDSSQQFLPANVQRADTPNDPDYDGAEPDDPDAVGNHNIYDERFDLFGFPSALTSTSALYGDGPNTGKPQISGFNAAGAWKLERGRSDVTVAILDTGIKWDREDLRLQVHLNKGELPVPNHQPRRAELGCVERPGGRLLRHAPRLRRQRRRRASTSSTTSATPASRRTAVSTARPGRWTRRT